MGILLGFLLFIFIVVCVMLCLLVLIQSDKGGGISGAIGGGLGGANSLLGTQDTANILTRGTAIFSATFLILCIVLSFVFSKANVSTEKSLLKSRAEKQQNYSPASILNNKALPVEQGSAPVQSAPAASAPLPVAPAQTAPAASVPVTQAPVTQEKAAPATAKPVAPATEQKK